MDSGTITALIQIMANAQPPTSAELIEDATSFARTLIEAVLYRPATALNYPESLGDMLYPLVEMLHRLTPGLNRPTMNDPEYSQLNSPFRLQTILELLKDRPSMDFRLEYLASRYVEILETANYLEVGNKWTSRDFEVLLNAIVSSEPSRILECDTIWNNEATFVVVSGCRTRRFAAIATEENEKRWIWLEFTDHTSSSSPVLKLELISARVCSKNVAIYGVPLVDSSIFAIDSLSSRGYWSKTKLPDIQKALWKRILPS